MWIFTANRNNGLLLAYHGRQQPITADFTSLYFHKNIIMWGLKRGKTSNRWQIGNTNKAKDYKKV